MQRRSRKLVGLVLALAIGYFFFLRAREARLNYWLRRDAQQGIAKITKNFWGGHGQFVYEYDAKQNHYAGISVKNWRDPKYREQGMESLVPVFYSASHPWLSALYMPETIITGLPALIIALVIELFAIITFINPSSKWALDLSDKKRDGTPLNK